MSETADDAGVLVGVLGIAALSPAVILVWILLLKLIGYLHRFWFGRAITAFIAVWRLALGVLGLAGAAIILLRANAAAPAVNPTLLAWTAIFSFLTFYFGLALLASGRPGRTHSDKSAQGGATA